MLINIGSSAAESGDVVDLLLACHESIRFFIDLAVRIADTTDSLLTDHDRKTMLQELRTCRSSPPE
jgi:hypothetical protein